VTSRLIEEIILTWRTAKTANRRDNISRFLYAWRTPLWSIAAHRWYRVDTAAGVSAMTLCAVHVELSLSRIPHGGKHRTRSLCNYSKNGSQTKAVASASQLSPYRPTLALLHTHTRAVFRPFPAGSKPSQRTGTSYRLTHGKSAAATTRRSARYQQSQQLEYCGGRAVQSSSDWHCLASHCASPRVTRPPC
jgi:hypothetical protein